MKIITIICSIYLTGLFLATSLAFLPVSAVLRVATGWCDRQLKVLHLFSCFWASCYTWLNPLWNVRITGREHIAGKKAYVMVSNHQSIVDILVIYRIFKHFKWVGKASLFNVPVIGWNMYLNRYVKIERNRISSQRKMLRQCEENICKGNSVMIFPEGTRSSGGQMKTFRDGAFMIAVRQKADIVPMVIDGTALTIQGKFPFTFQRIRLHILPPVPFEHFQHMSVPEVSRYILQLMSDELQHMRS
ncbi:MAG: 1-acyl-sn-glycerol-3-phosphate acyltransferase [Bacteroidales bacterium]|jgi:1-acyl-sn-glycerol-3-phosphate acyltransferase|nr:1-acyl-sn-glycerol-3-phosphate acyltransferase [Bacteroidales bacterium]